MNSMRLSRNEWLAVVLLILFFIVIRLPGLHQPYHQDEYKWALIVEKGSPLAGTIPHPPLDELTYVAADRLFGNEYLRVLPLLLSVLNCLLLFTVVRRRFGTETGLWAIALYAGVFYSVLASLMVDTDGEVLTFFFLLLLFSYDQWISRSGTVSGRWWGVLMLTFATLGMLVKLSFIVPVGSLLLELFLSKRTEFTGQQLLRYAGVVGAAFLIVVGGVWGAHYIQPGFNITQTLNFWSTFIDFTGRNFLQTFIQVAKVVMYLSPILVFAPLFLVKKELVHVRLFVTYLVIGVVFHLVLLDFSAGALDRYLQFSIVPLVVMAAVVLSAELRWAWIRQYGATLVLGALVVAVLYTVQLMPHFVLSLHPKLAWLTRIWAFEWNLLFPFTGGSGPFGVYVSFLFIALSYLLCAALTCVGLFKRDFRPHAIAAILLLSIGYNIAFAEEYSYGLINGNPGVVLTQSLQYIQQSPHIDKVITYNDIGTYELIRMGKYKQRLYVAPMFEEGNRETLRDFYGDYLVVDIPRLNPGGFQARFLATCAERFRATSGVISAKVLDCRTGDRTILE